jgi:hypothetical protein
MGQESTLVFDKGRCLELLTHGLNQSCYLKNQYQTLFSCFEINFLVGTLFKKGLFGSLRQFDFLSSFYKIL